MHSESANLGNQVFPQDLLSSLLKMTEVFIGNVALTGSVKLISSTPCAPGYGTTHAYSKRCNNISKGMPWFEKGDKNTDRVWRLSERTTVNIVSISHSADNSNLNLPTKMSLLPKAGRVSCPWLDSSSPTLVSSDDSFTALKLREAYVPAELAVWSRLDPQFRR
jgi:hypothetical protein